MPGNNPNQNLNHEENKSKKPIHGFPGMEIPADEHGKTPRTSQEVSDARKANVDATEKLTPGEGSKKKL